MERSWAVEVVRIRTTCRNAACRANTVVGEKNVSHRGHWVHRENNKVLDNNSILLSVLSVPRVSETNGRETKLSLTEYTEFTEKSFAFLIF